jgi:hypothetical protein
MNGLHDFLVTLCKVFNDTVLPSIQGHFSENAPILLDLEGSAAFSI